MTHTEYMRAWRQKNLAKQRVYEKAQREKLSAKIKTDPEFAKARREWRKRYSAEYRKRPGRAEQNRECSRRYFAEHKSEYAQKQTHRRKTRIQYRLAHSLRERIRAALDGRSKSARSFELIGCSTDRLKSQLTFLFQSGMAWDNYGEWHVDHIRPCASFDLADPEQQKECFHHTNLQPLWAEDNLRKGAKELV